MSLALSIIIRRDSGLTGSNPGAKLVGDEFETQDRLRSLRNARFAVRVYFSPDTSQSLNSEHGSGLTWREMYEC